MSPVERAMSPTQTLHRALSQTKRPMGPRGPTPTHPAASPAPTVFATPTINSTTPQVVAEVSATLPSTTSHNQRQPSSIPISIARRSTQQAALGVAASIPSTTPTLHGSSHVKSRILSTESGGSKRRVSDDWKRARPTVPSPSTSSASHPLPHPYHHSSSMMTTTSGSATLLPGSPETNSPLSPSSSLKKRDRTQTMLDHDEEDLDSNQPLSYPSLTPSSLTATTTNQNTAHSTTSAGATAGIAAPAPAATTAVVASGAGGGSGIGSPSLSSHGFHQENKKPRRESEENSLTLLEKMRSPLGRRIGSSSPIKGTANGHYGTSPLPPPPGEGPRKGSMGGLKRMVYTEEDLEGMELEERVMILACGLKDEVWLFGVFYFLFLQRRPFKLALINFGS